VSVAVSTLATLAGRGTAVKSAFRKIQAKNVDREGTVTEPWPYRGLTVT